MALKASAARNSWKERWDACHCKGSSWSTLTNGILSLTIESVSALVSKELPHRSALLVRARASGDASRADQTHENRSKPERCWHLKVGAWRPWFVMELEGFDKEELLLSGREAFSRQVDAKASSSQSYCAQKFRPRRQRGSCSLPNNLLRGLLRRSAGARQVCCPRCSGDIRL